MSSNRLLLEMTRVHLDEEPVVRKKKDAFTREGQKWSWDFALLVPVRDEDALRETKKRPTSLLGKEKFDQVVVKVRATAARLGRHADATNFRMRLAPAEVSRRLAEGLADAVDVDDYVVYPRRNGWRYRGVEMDTAIVDAEGLCPLYGSSEHMFGEFRDDPDDAALYAKNARSESPFRGVDRVKLIMSVLTHPVRDGGAGLPLEKLVAAEVVSAALHDWSELKQVEAKWLVYWAWPWNMPLDRIADYYGEKATYFMIAAVAGFAVQVDISVSVNLQNAESVPYFCLFMALWSSAFIAQWKRTQSRWAMRWGMVGFEEVETDRPEFAADPQTALIHSPVDGELTTYFPPAVAARRAR
ncbi:intracellular chloride channel [Aureococcus anophagefferens]|nr:intracellular chloride channel [Aureococcus anophagefferens]